MAEKVSCLNCTALLVNLPTCWVEGERASLGKCIKKEFHIRQTDRYCKHHNAIDPNHFPNYLDYQRRKLDHIHKTLDLIEEYHRGVVELPPKPRGVKTSVNREGSEDSEA